MSSSTKERHLSVNEEPALLRALSGPDMDTIMGKPVEVEGPRLPLKKTVLKITVIMETTTKPGLQ